jgi:hypothetical protein
MEHDERIHLQLSRVCENQDTQITSLRLHSKLSNAIVTARESGKSCSIVFDSSTSGCLTIDEETHAFQMVRETSTNEVYVIESCGNKAQMIGSITEKLLLMSSSLESSHTRPQFSSSQNLRTIRSTKRLSDSAIPSSSSPVGRDVATTAKAASSVSNESEIKLHSGNANQTTGPSTQKSSRRTAPKDMCEMTVPWVCLKDVSSAVKAKDITNFFSELSILQIYACYFHEVESNSTDQSSRRSLVDLYVAFEHLASAAVALNYHGEKLLSSSSSVTVDDSTVSIVPVTSEEASLASAIGIQIELASWLSAIQQADTIKGDGTTWQVGDIEAIVMRIDPSSAEFCGIAGTLGEVSFSPRFLFYDQSKQLRAGHCIPMNSCPTGDFNRKYDCYGEGPDTNIKQQYVTDLDALFPLRESLKKNNIRQVDLARAVAERILYKLHVDSALNLLLGSSLSHQFMPPSDSENSGEPTYYIKLCFQDKLILLYKMAHASLLQYCMEASCDKSDQISSEDYNDYNP